MFGIEDWTEENLGFTTGEPIWDKIDLYSIILTDDELDYNFPESSAW